MPRRARDIQGC